MIGQGLHEVTKKGSATISKILYMRLTFKQGQSQKQPSTSQHAVRSGRCFNSLDTLEHLRVIYT